MGDLKLTDTVSSLKGEANFAVWRDSLRRFINASDFDLWPVITGALTCSIDEPLNVPSDEDVRHSISAETGISPQKVTAAETSAWVKQHILDPNQEFEWFRKKHALGVYYVAASLGENIRTFIHGIEDAHEAYDIICKIYGNVSSHTFQLKWSNWVVCKYRPGGNAVVFLAKWKKALSELKQCYADAHLEAPFEYAQFMEAIQANPVTENFLNNFKPKLTERNLMELCFAEFMASESSRK
ncbi:hypothetical protein PEBR_17643 [Penicillium brasilianum]|uniref:Uncharacterized protein n=1 Tax=Penicillium brasilianum TaxID=104259 RepID=A0A1S9RPS7_PENBI|nr:hypothetical protein PEBR_17643 [Penicillium brasilianum]